MVLVSIFASSASSSPSSFGAEAVEDLVDAVPGEEANQVVLRGEKEAGLAGVPLAARAAAKLVVDPAGLVALGPDDEQPTDLAHLIRLRLDLGLELLDQGLQLLLVTLILGGQAELAKFCLSHALGTAAELDVHAAPRHVRGDGDGALASRLGDRLTLPLRVLGLGIEDDVVDPPALELVGEHLRGLD
jgi:hypothetical protein